MLTRTKQEPSETALVTRVQDGDLDAYSELMERHVRRVRAWLAMRVPAPHLVDELAHDTFLLAFRKISEFTPGTSFGAWIRAIAWQLLRRELLRFSRDKSNRTRFAQHFEALSEIEAPPPELQRRLIVLEECLGAVPRAQKTLLELKYRRDFSSKEIADDVSQTEEWVRTNLYRIRNRLRECIERKLDSTAAHPAP